MKNKKRLIIVGGHGSGEIAMSVFEDINKVDDQWIIEGYLNDIKEPGEYLGSHKVLGPSDTVKDYVDKGYYVHYTLHFNAKNKEERVRKLRSYNIPDEAFATGIHPRAYLNPSTKVGNGVLMLPFSATSFGCELKNCIHVYTNGFIGHDAIIDNYATVTAHSIIGGRVNVLEGGHIGLNSSVREDITIGKYSIVGMGSVVVKDAGDKEVVVGNPAKLIKKL